MKRGAPLARKTPLAPGKPLARGKTLERKTPLAPGKPLTRTAPMARTAPAPVVRPAPDKTPETRPRRRPANTGPTRAQRAVVLDRDKGRCVRCGIEVGGSVGYNDHHRQGRGMGGRQGAARAAANSPANRLTACGSGTTGCHGWITEHPAEAARLGLVVRRGGSTDPATVPVRTWHGWVLLDHDGGTAPCPAPPDGDASNV